MLTAHCHRHGRLDSLGCDSGHAATRLELQHGGSLVYHSRLPPCQEGYQVMDQPSPPSPAAGPQDGGLRTTTLSWTGPPGPDVPDQRGARPSWAVVASAVNESICAWPPSVPTLPSGARAFDRNGSQSPTSWLLAGWLAARFFVCLQCAQA